MTRRIGALILAAGSSSRFGGCKLLAPLAGRPLLQHAVDQVAPLLPGAVHAVTGRWHQALLAAEQRAELSGVQLLHHAGWQQGMGSSLAFGVGRLAAHYDALLVLLADQVGVTRADLAQMLACFDGQHSVCARYADRRGVPALFGRAQFAALQQLSGDRGARVLLSDAQGLIEYPLPDGVYDIDTPEQLSAWQAQAD